MVNIPVINCDDFSCKFNFVGNYQFCVKENIDIENGRCLSYEEDFSKCPDCGTGLVEDVQKHPYGDTYVNERISICPNCEG